MAKKKEVGSKTLSVKYKNKKFADVIEDAANEEGMSTAAIQRQAMINALRELKGDEFVDELLEETGERDLKWRNKKED